MSAGTPSARQILGFAILVGVFGTVAAMALMPPENAQSPPQSYFGPQAADQVASVEGINATVETVIEHEKGSSRSVARVSLRPSTGALRSEQRSATDREWELRVSNGSVLWLYDDDESEGKTITLQSGDSSVDIDRLQRLFQQIHRTQTATTPGETTPRPGVEPLPAVPHSAGERTSGGTAIAGGPLNITYEGNETVDGRKTYVVTLSSPTADSGAVVSDYTQRLWIDVEHYYPLKRHTSWRKDDEQRTITVTYTDVTFNPGLDDELFTFDPPEDATITDSDTPQHWQYDSVATLKQDATMSVPDPDLPEGFSFVSATRTRGRVRSIGLQYVNTTGELAISKNNLTYYQPRTDGDVVDIGSVQGAFRDRGPKQSVSWTCTDFRYSVTGSGIRKAVLVDVATSIGC